MHPAIDFKIPPSILGCNISPSLLRVSTIRMLPILVALAAFIAKKAEIDTMLTRLQALSDEHFEANPDEIHWGHVGTLNHYRAKLREITDSAFKEVEHAE